MPINAVETPIIAIVAFALWTALLSLSIPVWRLILVGLRRARTSDFTPGDGHGSPGYWRLNRAHINAVENLAVFSALAVAALAAGVSDPVFGQFCVAVLIARFCQTALHVISGETLFVSLRFAAFLVQIVCYIGMAAMVIDRAL